MLEVRLKVLFGPDQCFRGNVSLKILKAGAGAYLTAHIFPPTLLSLKKISAPETSHFQLRVH